MHRGLSLVVFAAVALAQVPKEDPFMVATMAYQKARNQGNYGEAGAQRELARTLLDQIPADSPQFTNWVRQVVMLYQESDLTLLGMTVAQTALARVTEPNRADLLQLIAEMYQQERNLLQSAAYREKQISALEKAGSKPATPAGGITMSRLGSFRAFSSRMYSPGDSKTFHYIQLANLYQQLGRPDAVAATTKRMMLLKPSLETLGDFYEQRGQLDEAAAVYGKEIGDPADDVRLSGLQSLASIYQRERRVPEAIELTKQVVASLNASGKQAQALSIRMNLASLLAHAGKIEEGDQTFAQVLSESRSAADGSDLNVTFAYANYLSETNRNAQGTAMLNDFMTSHSSLSPQQQSEVLMQLSYASSRSGDAKRAEQYQQASREKQPISQPFAGNMSGKSFAASQAAMRAGKFEEAFELAVRAIDDVSSSENGTLDYYQVFNLAMEFLNKKQGLLAERLYQRLFAYVEPSAAQNPRILLSTLENYARFLMGQDRFNDVPALIKRYRELLIATRGPGNGGLEQPLRLTIQFEQMHGTPRGVVAAAEELIALQESLSGDTSEPYLRALEEAASAYRSAGDSVRSLPLYNKTVLISDLVFLPANIQRAQTRMTAAMAFAQQKQFDEAEKLANEAVAIAESIPQAGDGFLSQRAQIRQMKIATDGTSPWFTRTKPKL